MERKTTNHIQLVPKLVFAFVFDVILGQRAECVFDVAKSALPIFYNGASILVSWIDSSNSTVAIVRDWLNPMSYCSGFWKNSTFAA